MSKLPFPTQMAESILFKLIIIIYVATCDSVFETVAFGLCPLVSSLTTRQAR